MHTGVTEVVTLLGKSITRGKAALHKVFEGQETEAVPLMTHTAIALKIDCRHLPNRVRTSFTLVGNSADSRRLAQCRDPLYCNT